MSACPVDPSALTLPPPPPIEDDEAAPGPWLDDPSYAVAAFLRGLEAPADAA